MFACKESTSRRTQISEDEAKSRWAVIDWKDKPSEGEFVAGRKGRLKKVYGPKQANEPQT